MSQSANSAGGLPGLRTRTCIPTFGCCSRFCWAWVFRICCSGLARIVQHPKEYRVYWVHLVWSLFLFLYLIHFWGWEFRLRQVMEWTFPRYFFVALYATLLYMLCTLLFPEEMGDYKGFD